MSDEPRTTEILDAASDVLERSLEDASALSDIEASAVQRLIAALVRVYANKLEAGEDFMPFATGSQSPSPTDTVVLASDLLTSVSIEPFELAMWRAWGNVRSVQTGGVEDDG